MINKNAKDNIIIPLIIEKGINTSYIDSLFMALFYTPSYIEHDLLNNTPINPEYIYIQELIKTKFVDLVRKHKNITNINEIRNYLYMIGWKSFEQLLDNHNIIDLYSFLIEKCNGSIIKIKNQNNNIEKQSYIRLKILEKDNEITIKELLIRWKNDNEIINNPVLIGIYIDRFYDNLKLKTKVEIQKKIIPIKESENIKWIFHSVICYNMDKDHYYTLLQNYGKWFIFDNNKIPSLYEISMDNKEIINMIKTECIFVIYNIIL